MPRTFSLRWPHHSTHAARARRPIVRPRRSILALGTPARTRSATPWMFRHNRPRKAAMR